jgi:hypothetical protein
MNKKLFSRAVAMVLETMVHDSSRIMKSKYRGLSEGTEHLYLAASVALNSG